MTSEADSVHPFLWQNARTVAHARVLLALGNALVIYLDPSLPTSTSWPVLVTTYGNVVLLMAYAAWVWRYEASPNAPPFLPRLVTWLDVLFSATLIASTGPLHSPFYIWNIFTLVGCALKNDRRTVVRVCLAEIALYFLICAPSFGQPDFVAGTFLVRTAYLFVIALVLALIGQQLLEQNRMLARLQQAALHLSEGRSIGDILGHLADSLTDLLEVEQVAVAVSEDETGTARPRLVNLDRTQGDALLRLARERLAAAPRSPQIVVSNDPGSDPHFAATPEALAGVRNLLITRLPGSGSPGLLVATNRAGERGFTTTDRSVAQLLAAQAGPLLETARLQEQRRYHASIDERQRIAGELHDRLIQTLAGMDIRIVACEAMARQEQWERLPERLQSLKRLAEEALEEARGAISELAPVRLREEGLAIYLQDCLRMFQERVAIPVDAAIHLIGPEVPEPTALLLIGLLREGLNNIRKHARAARVKLTITQAGDQVHFQLSDDGVGFDPAQNSLFGAPTRQYGLAYLRERVTRLGGELTIRSAAAPHGGRDEERRMRNEAGRRDLISHSSSLVPHSSSLVPSPQRPGTTLEARVPLVTEERLVSLYSLSEA